MIEAGCAQVREALGAYALTALDSAEEQRVRVHLSGCGDCRAELAGLRSAVAALSALSAAEAAIGPLKPHVDTPRPGPLPPPHVDATAVRPLAPPRFSAAAARPGSRPGRGRRRLLAAATAAVVAAGLVGYGAGALTERSAGAVAARGAGAAPGLRFTRTTSAADTVTGTRAEVATAVQPWGTWVQLTLHRDRVPAPERCRLVVHAHDGSTQVASTWSAEHAGTFAVPGGVGFAPADIAWYEVQTLEGQRLLAVPA